ncbi:MAG: SDR family oxidoreductase [Bacteroidia bacterium]|nr:SDR family oxidoreductase [Bacteroidia bacterium]
MYGSLLTVVKPYKLLYLLKDNTFVKIIKPKTLKTILITGATSGIGEACATLFAKNGYQIIITGRRKERLENLEKLLHSKYNSSVHSLNFDIAKHEECKKAIESLPDEFKNIDVLINNAGLAAGLSPIQEGLLSDWETMIDINLKGLLYITRLIAPKMAARKSGHIVNLSSVAGKENYANGNVYCATKHAVDSLSQTMRIDLLQYGVKVTNIAPGMVETEFSLVRFKGDENRAKNVYIGVTPLTAHDIAEAIFWAVSRPDHVNISDIVITPKAQANSTTTIRR